MPIIHLTLNHGKINQNKICWGVVSRYFKREIKGSVSLLFIRTIERKEMPEISRFFGIIIRMFYDEHNPPHFHAEYSGKKAVFDFDGNVIKVSD